MTAIVTNQSHTTRPENLQRIRYFGGFTLLELIVTVAIAAVLVTLATPSLQSTVERWRVNTTKDAFAASLYLARREAIKNDGSVVMTRRAPDGTCTHATEARNWGCGWDLCIDTNGDRKCTPPAQPPLINEDIPLQSIDVPKSVNAVVSSNTSMLVFSRWGHPNGLGVIGVTFSPHPAGTESAATTTLCMSSGGRIRFVAAASCS